MIVKIHGANDMPKGRALKIDFAFVTGFDVLSGTFVDGKE